MIRAINPVAVKLPGANLRKKDVPDLISLFGQTDANGLVWRIRVIKKAEIDSRGVLGINGKINAVTTPGRSQRVRFAQPNFQRSHSRRFFSSSTHSAYSAAERMVSAFFGLLTRRIIKPRRIVWL